MKSSPMRVGATFIGPWESLDIHLPLGGAYPNGEFKIFHIFEVTNDKVC